jgi:putative ABC transport system permease protein
MDMGARWNKIIHDIWDNKSRSLLVIFTLAIGIAAVGMINNTARMMKRDLFGGFANTNPASISLSISPFPKELASSVTALRAVELAEATRTVPAFIRDSKAVRHYLQMVAVPDFRNIQINRISVEEGATEPGLRDILLERSTAQGLRLSLGDMLPVEMENGNRYNLRISGIIHDMSIQHYSVSGEALGYVSMATLEWMRETPYYNTLKVIVADNKLDREHVLSVAGYARDQVIEPAGYKVFAMSIMSPDGTPGDYWAKQQVSGVLLMLQIMSILAILLCGGLMVNTISAVLVQQIKQIGIMRSVGASRRQIILLYLGYVSVLSVIGLVIAIPLGIAGSQWLNHLAADFMNYNASPVDLPWAILLLQISLGLLMPPIVAIFPILSGTRLSVYDAIYQYGMISGEGKRGWIEKLLVSVRHINPPIMLSLRNTFRNKPRLAFTLITLTVAGAMFMAVFSSYSTVQNQVKELARYIAFDASINIPGGANRYTAEREARRIPEVKVAEGWAIDNGFIVHPDGSEGDRIEIVGLPDNPQTIEPRLITGRWLLPGDTNQVVVNEDLTAKESGIRVGDEISIKFNGLEKPLEIVGIASKHMMGARIYMNITQLAKMTGRYNQVDTLRVLATPGALVSAAEQLAIGKDLEKRFEDARLSQGSSETRSEIFKALGSAFNILLAVLLLVAIILAVIGGLGLTGTMGLNILERTREIGVLRAVGASHFSVRQVVVVEGVSVALISWVLSALVSYPVGRLLAEALIRTSFGTQASFSYSPWGLLTWMAVVILIGVFASLAPAHNAARLTVREVLNYE